MQASCWHARFGHNDTEVWQDSTDWFRLCDVGSSRSFFKVVEAGSTMIWWINEKYVKNSNLKQRNIDYKLLKITLNFLTFIAISCLRASDRLMSELSDNPPHKDGGQSPLLYPPSLLSPPCSDMAAPMKLMMADSLSKQTPKHPWKYQSEKNDRDIPFRTPFLSVCLVSLHTVWRHTRMVTFLWALS